MEHTYANGDKYKGFLWRNKRQGEDGEFMLHDGSLYRGGFKTDLYNGDGVLKLRSGDSYSGKFSQGEKVTRSFYASFFWY